MTEFSVMFIRSINYTVLNTRSGVAKKNKNNCYWVIEKRSLKKSIVTAIFILDKTAHSTINICSVQRKDTRVFKSVFMPRSLMQIKLA